MNTHFCLLPLTTPQRADKFIASLLPRFSRSFWQKQFAEGCITCNGAAIASTTMLRGGEIVVTLPPQLINSIDLPVLYEDDDVVVVNKPAGILTHAKGVVADEATVADFVRPRLQSAMDGDRPGIVHRLDRDTSGVLIAAKNPEASQWLHEQFSQRKVQKTYYALIEGQLKTPEAVLKLPIERSPKEPQKFRVSANGKSAETTYKVLQQFKNSTLVELHPRTGRTHQLRVHMAYLGHPIVGDRLYGREQKALHGRLFLHAAELKITLPNQQQKVFNAPLPADLEQFLQEYTK